MKITIIENGIVHLPFEELCGSTPLISGSEKPGERLSFWAGSIPQTPPPCWVFHNVEKVQRLDPGTREKVNPLLTQGGASPWGWTGYGCLPYHTGVD